MKGTVDIDNTTDWVKEESSQIGSDDIEANGLKWTSVDMFGPLLKTNVYFVMNTDVSGSPGIHWMACCCPSGEKILYIADTLGIDNRRPYDALMKEIAEESGYDIQFYPHKIQLSFSTHCGWFAIVIGKLFEWLAKSNKLDIPIIEKYLEELFGKTADIDDEELLIKIFGLVET